mgnify:CR=1 FL=1|jgi:hypothetical protein
MEIQKLIERYESYEGIWDAPGAEAARKCLLRDLKQLEELPSGHAEEAPRYVKNVLARLRELPLHDREVWLKAIMSEFEQDFSHAKWKEGYEQGEFEGALEREKVIIPQSVADWIKVAKPIYSLSGAMVYGSPGVNKWLESWDNQETFARAWLDGYEVKQEKRYLVKLKGVFKGYEYLNFKFGRVWIFSNEEENEEYRTHHTKKELEDADFGWVFDCPGIEIEEVI